VWTRPRFGELNDGRRTERYIRALRSVSDEGPPTGALVVVVVVVAVVAAAGV